MSSRRLILRSLGRSTTPSASASRDTKGVEQAATIQELEDRLEEAGRDLLALGSRLRTEGLTAEELEAVRRLGDSLRGGLTGNPELIEQEFLAMLSLVEQLELQLAQSALGADESGVRTEAPAQVAQGYQNAVAEYFRRLSRAEQ